MHATKNSLPKPTMGSLFFSLTPCCMHDSTILRLSRYAPQPSASRVRLTPPSSTRLTQIKEQKKSRSRKHASEETKTKKTVERKSVSPRPFEGEKLFPGLGDRSKRCDVVLTLYDRRKEVVDSRPKHGARPGLSRETPFERQFMRGGVQRVRCEKLGSSYPRLPPPQ